MSTNSFQERSFFDAIRSGRVADVRQQVQADPALLKAYDYQCFGATPITSIAVKESLREDRAMIQVLIDLGADVNQRSDWWAGPWSPLHCAICCGNNELAKFLLDHGATLDVHTAAALGRLDDLQRLLDEDPSRLSERGGDGCLPLHFAGTIESARMLLQRGADIDARCVDHYSTAVQYLAHIRPDVVRFLFSQGAQADIFSAVLAGDVELVRKMIAADPMIAFERINQERFPPGPKHDVLNNLTFVVGQNATPLHAAARGNRPEMVEILVRVRSDVNVRGGYDDAAPLHLAAWHDHSEVADKLIDCGADVNLRSGKIHNNSPAGWAIVAGSHRVFSRLLNRGAELLPWFIDDAQAAVAGEFRKYKLAPQESYDAILARLQEQSRG